MYYVLKSKITPKISEFVIPGNHIVVNGDIFEQLEKRPVGRSIAYRLKAVNSDEKITCYA